MGTAIQKKLGVFVTIATETMMNNLTTNKKTFYICKNNLIIGKLYRHIRKPHRNTFVLDTPH